MLRILIIAAVLAAVGCKDTQQAMSACYEESFLAQAAQLCADCTEAQLAEVASRLESDALLVHSLAVELKTQQKGE